MTDQEWEELTRDIDWARWTITCRMMITRIVQGQMDGAHDALRYFCREPRRVPATGESPVAAVFDVRTANTLEQGGYYDVESVRMAHDDDLREIGGLSQNSIDGIRSTIEGVMAGKVLETYGDLDLTELIDEEVCVRSLPASGTTVRSSPAAELVTQRSRDHTPKESRTMTNEEEVLQAFELIMSSPDTASEAIEKQIAQREKLIEQQKFEISRLRKIQRNFGLGESKPAKTGGKLSKRDAIEEKIFVYLKANGPTGVATIAKHLEMMATVVGKTVSTSTRLAKDAVTNRVIIRAGA